MREDLFLRIFFERQAVKLCRETVFRELSNEGSDEVFSPACDEWHLRLRKRQPFESTSCKLGVGGRETRYRFRVPSDWASMVPEPCWSLGRSEIDLVRDRRYDSGVRIREGAVGRAAGGFLPTLEKYITSVGGG